jgi:hypothetical protein
MISFRTHAHLTPESSIVWSALMLLINTATHQSPVELSVDQFRAFNRQRVTTWILPHALTNELDHVKHAWTEQLSVGSNRGTGAAKVVITIWDDGMAFIRAQCDCQTQQPSSCPVQSIIAFPRT